MSENAAYSVLAGGDDLALESIGLCLIFKHTGRQSEVREGESMREEAAKGRSGGYVRLDWDEEMILKGGDGR